MNSLSKALLFLFACVVGYVLVVHGSRALNASLPKDMPKDANFVASGYDLDHNEARGQWIACRDNYQENTDFCRVTDQKGIVVYQGAFAPYDYPEPLPNDQLQISTRSGNIWVNGPAESGPVPVIPLRNGRLLVPVQDREALADRWRNNPAELRRIAGL